MRTYHLTTIAGITGGSPLRQILCWALAGFGLGVVSGTAYLVLDGDYAFDIPPWAQIVFYPGLQAGKTAYIWRWGLEVCKVVGVLAVGFAYATLAALARFAWFSFKHRRLSTAAGPNSQ